MLILVTGATGFVGNNVTRLLLAHGHTVRVLVREDADPRPLHGLAVERVLGDIRDPEAVERACAGASAVIHAAAYLHIGHRRYAYQREINVGGTRNVVKAARQSQARLLHISSVDALGVRRDGVPADESTPRVGNTPCGYVKTKQQAERMVLEAAREGLDAVVLNPGFMLGPWDWKPSSGRMFLEVVHKQPLFAPHGGASVCDVEDVAKGIVAALLRAPSGRQYILAGFNLTYFEIWRRMAALAGSRPPRLRVGYIIPLVAGLAGDVLGMIEGSEGTLNSMVARMSGLEHFYSSARAQAELGYENRSLDETFRRAYEWMIERHGL
ncbi:MAG: NAD-dependent epimerase/dehydratase family protein [Pirellulales bacterium]